MNVRTAVKKIEQRGALLVFPINNQKQPPSLWYEFYPKSKMRWEWDESGDNRVGELWHLREALSRSQKVVYTKWYRGRATFFSRELYVALLKIFVSTRSLSKGAQNLLSQLEEESPLSTKELKKRAKLGGRPLEGTYTKALKELWDHFLIVAFGEVDDGAFPSLALGATQVLFEDLWLEAQQLTELAAMATVERLLADNPSFWEEVQKQLKKKKVPTPHLMPLVGVLSTGKGASKGTKKDRPKAIVRGEDLYLIRKSSRT